jgi:hypothetical protein
VTPVVVNFSESYGLADAQEQSRSRGLSPLRCRHSRDPFYKTLERHFFSIVMVSWWFSSSPAAGAILGRRYAAQPPRSGGTILPWGVFVRTVLVWHITWSANSMARSGYRTYPTSDDNATANQPITLGSGQVAPTTTLIPARHNPAILVGSTGPPCHPRSVAVGWNVVGRQPSTLAVKPR